MTTVPMPFARWSPNWGGALAGLVAAAAIVLSSIGQGQAALAILGALGAAASILLAAGQLQLTRAGGAAADRAGHIFRALPAAIAVTDKKGIVLWQSAAFSDAAGGIVADDNLLKLGQRQPEDSAAIFRLFAAARNGNAHEETIATPPLAHGGPFRLKVFPFMEQGARAPLLIWQIDKTKRDAAGGPLGSSVLDTLPVAAVLVGKDLAIEAANHSFEKLTGCSAAGKEAWTFFRTNRGNPFTRARLRDILAKSESSAAVQIASASGSYLPAALHARAVPPGGQEGAGAQLWLVIPAGGVGESLDETFDTLLARSPVAMALTSFKGVVHTANEAFRHLFAGPAAAGELTGKALSSLVDEFCAQSLRERLAVLSSDSFAGSGAVEMDVAPKGTPGRRIRLTIFPTVNDGHLLVSAIEAAAPALIDEQTAQSQKLQAVGELAGGIAHDFNNLLTAIIGFSDLLLRRFRASDPAFKDLMNIKNNATRAAELVKQILAYSRRQTLLPAILKVTDVIEEFQATMGRTLGEKVKAKIQHGRDLWFVKADEGQLFQVIMNLAVNARDAMSDGGEITIRTANISERDSLDLKDRGLDRGEYVMCEVRDTGTGIKPEHLEKIFDPFFSTKEVGKGTGLGLSTVYGIVKQTGGTILVDSEIGVGTSFRIYLPRYVETEEDLRALENKAETHDKVVDLTGSGTVLLVEDEDAVRSFASRALATRGYTVLEAASGVEALEIMDREGGKVDLVVSDVVMPEMDGPTLLRHLRERNPDIRIVFMSGYAEEAFRKNLNDEEDFVFLPKPFTLKKLAETVKLAVA